MKTATSIKMPKIKRSFRRIEKRLVGVYVLAGGGGGGGTHVGGGMRWWRGEQGGGGGCGRS